MHSTTGCSGRCPTSPSHPKSTPSILPRPLAHPYAHSARVCPLCQPAPCMRLAPSCALGVQVTGGLLSAAGSLQVVPRHFAAAVGAACRTWRWVVQRVFCGRKNSRSGESDRGEAYEEAPWPGASRSRVCVASRRFDRASRCHAIRTAFGRLPSCDRAGRAERQFCGCGACSAEAGDAGGNRAGRQATGSCVDVRRSPQGAFGMH